MSERKINSIILLAGILSGIVCILYSIVPRGIGLSEDSISYLSAAYSLHHAGQMLDTDGTPFVAWAPLYSLLIAALEFLPFKIENSLAVFSMIIYITTVFTSWILIQRSIDKTVFRIICLTAVIFSFTVLQVYTMALSESLFLLLVNVGLILLVNMREDKRQTDVLLIGFIIALALLQRYAGIFLIPLVLITFNKPSTVNRKLIFLLLALLPIGVWLLRNWMLSDTLTGFRLYDAARLWNNVTVLAETLTSWILPMKIPLAIRIIMMAPLVYVWKKGASGKNGIHSLTVVTYLLMLTGCYLVLSFEEPRDRLLSPIYIPFFILLISSLEKFAGEKLESYGLIVAVLMCIWLVYPVSRVVKHIQIWHHEGAEIYNKSSWNDSETIAWLNENEIPGKIFSNDAPAIYYLTGRNAYRIPRRIYSLDVFNNKVEDGSFLVWFENRDLYNLQIIQQKHILKILARFNDGAIFVIHNK